jgi:integrase
MVMPTVHNKRHVYINQEDFHSKLLAHCDDPEASALFKLAFYTGLRWRSEILMLKKDQVLMSEGKAWLSIPDTKRTELRI